MELNEKLHGTGHVGDCMSTGMSDSYVSNTFVIVTMPFDNVIQLS